jgi:DNA-directed RNA polymerase subunit alpha
MTNELSPIASLISAGRADLGLMLGMLESRKQGYPGIDLSDCDLSNSTFRGINFRGADFSRSSFDNTVFVDCDLSDARFDGAEISKAIFVNCAGVKIKGRLNIDFPKPRIPRTRIESGLGADKQATITAEPLERGFGVTLGHALRRVLLSSVPGASITAIQIDGVVHEFSSIAGAREDVTDIVLNVKQIALRMHAEGPKRLSLRKQGPGEVTAGDIAAMADIEILNPELVICTLDEKVEFRMELTVATGKGYVPAHRNRPEDAPIGLIPVDSLFSPVKKVSYKVENTREGQILDYDKLTLSVETNGAVTPDNAVAYAARILQDQLQVFTTYEEATRNLTFSPVLLTGPQ